MDYSTTIADTNIESIEVDQKDNISDTNSVTKILKRKSKPYFPSNNNGLYINNAETGEIYSDIVGSNSEKKYFRVIDSTGTIDYNGNVSYGIKTPNKLFYKNADQYIHHRYNKYDKNNNINNIKY